MCVTPIVTGPTPTVGSEKVALTATGPTPTVVSERVAPTATVVNSDR